MHKTVRSMQAAALSLSTTHGQFNGICQVASVCPPHLIHASLGPPKSTTQTASQSVQPFFHCTIYQLMCVCISDNDRCVGRVGVCCAKAEMMPSSLQTFGRR